MKNKTKDTEIVIDGQTVKVKQLKPKHKKKDVYVARNTTTSCPNCLSTMKPNALGLFECSGDKLKVWVPDFARYKQMQHEQRMKYLTDLSNSSRFLELFDRWDYASSTDGKEEFNCGYTNILFPLTATSQVKIPDPLYTKILEQKLGRSLTEEEIYGESELWAYGNRILTSWRKNAIPVKIPFVILPNEDTVYEPVHTEKK